jgi:hypothetical protein
MAKASQRDCLPWLNGCVCEGLHDRVVVEALMRYDCINGHGRRLS